MKKVSAETSKRLTKVKSPSKLRPMSGMIDPTKYKPLKGYYTIPQLAKMFGKSRQTVLLYAKRHGIQLIRIGLIVIIHKSQLRHFKK